MIRFALVKGGVYRARVVLGWTESFAGNETVASKFRAVGFSDVSVRGSGLQRIVEGTWLNDDVKGAMPSQVDEVMVVSEPPVEKEKEKVVTPPLPRKKIEMIKTWVWYDPRTWF